MAGEADIWQPRTVVEAKANTQSVQQRFVASSAQSLFVLTDFAYTVGTGALEIYKNGLRLARDVDFVEQTSTTFSLTVAATAGDIILAIGFVGISGTVSVRDTDIYLATHQNLRDYAGTEVTVYTQGTLTAGDGGEGFWQKFTGAAVGTYVDDDTTVIRPTGGDGSVGWVKAVVVPRAVNDFAADTTGTLSAVSAFQSAINALPATSTHIIKVAPGTYLGDMTTLVYGTRVIIFDESDGPVTYSTAAPVATRIYRTATQANLVNAVSNANGTPMAVQGKVLLKAGAGAGLAWAVLGQVTSESTDATKAPVGVYGQGVAKNGSTAPIWGMVAEAADSRNDNTTYGSTYPTQPDNTQAAINGIEVDSVRTGPFNDLATRAMGIQLVAFGGSESTNSVEIHSANNIRSHSTDGTAQAGGASTITLATTARAVDSYYNNRLITILSGTGAGQERKITGYVGATKVATVDSAWTTVPDATSVYVVYDLYNSGMWRRGVKIFTNALNDVDGIGFELLSDAASGILISGNMNTEDFAVRRPTVASTVKEEYHVGIATTGFQLMRQHYHGGDSAGSSDAQYGIFDIIISDNTSGAHYGTFRFNPARNGALGGLSYFEIGDGVKIGQPAGGFKGGGTLNIAADLYKAGTKVVGARKTGWALATGTATRTTFDTATVTLSVLAEHVKALIDDLEGTAGHGLIGA